MAKVYATMDLVALLSMCARVLMCAFRAASLVSIPRLLRILIANDSLLLIPEN